MRFGELKGKKINELTILDEYKKEDKKIYCKVQCVCGKIFEVRRDSILREKTKSCGHLTQLSRKDITGQKFGRLTAIKAVERTSKKGTKWLCNCECGNEKIIELSYLIDGSCKSCGCLANERSKNAVETMKKENEKYYIGNTSIIAIKDKKILKNNTSGHRGVSWDKSRNLWQAQIIFKGKRYYLGRYVNIEDAINARKKAEEMYYKPILEEFQKNK